MELGTFTDERDGRTYKTTVINGQTWLAENFAFTFPYAPIGCYYNHKEKYAKYGRLYTWHEAISIVPKGWHLPTERELQKFINFYGEENGGIKLKSTKGWLRMSYRKHGDKNGNGTDEYGFNALPGGGMTKKHDYWDDDDDPQTFRFLGNKGYWWCSTEDPNTPNKSAFMFRLSNTETNILKWTANKNRRYSIRLIKD